MLLLLLFFLFSFSMCSFHNFQIEYDVTLIYNCEASNVTGVAMCLFVFHYFRSIQSNENIIYDFYKVWCNCYSIICVELLFYAVHDNWMCLKVSKISMYANSNFKKKLIKQMTDPDSLLSSLKNGFFFLFFVCVLSKQGHRNVQK